MTSAEGAPPGPLNLIGTAQRLEENPNFVFWVRFGLEAQPRSPYPYRGFRWYSSIPRALRAGKPFQ